MNSSIIAYRPREAATAEAEISALANVYKFVLESKKAAESTQPDGRDGTTVQGDSADALIVQD